MMKLTMTSINRNNNGFKRSLSALGLTLLVMSISACGGKKIATSDNSVEYKTAQAPVSYTHLTLPTIYSV